MKRVSLPASERNRCQQCKSNLMPGALNSVAPHSAWFRMYGVVWVCVDFSSPNNYGGDMDRQAAGAVALRCAHCGALACMH